MHLSKEEFQRLVRQGMDAMRDPGERNPLDSPEWRARLAAGAKARIADKRGGFLEVQIIDASDEEIEALRASSGNANLVGVGQSPKGQSRVVLADPAYIAKFHVTHPDSDHSQWPDEAFEVDVPANVDQGAGPPPGSSMLTYARVLFSPETVENVFEQIVADYRHEISEAMAVGGNQNALSEIHAHNRKAFVLAVLMAIAARLNKALKAAAGG